MIVFNEGLPGAGKSYDAVARHIVPAIKAGRHVYARLNGLSFEAIADHLKMPVESVRAILHLVEPGDVHGLADVVVQDSLIVIDECHEFYVASRQPLPDDQERFFAMHRHAGLDLILISQFYKRIHGAVRARIERKNLFRKLTALGMNKRYVVSFMAAVAPDRYEKTGSETRKYDPAIFALYQSVAPGTANLDVYEGGGKNVLAGKVKWVTVGMIVAVAFGGWYLLQFFSGGVALAPAMKAQKSTPATLEPFQRSASVGASAVSAKPAATVKLEPEAQYVLDLVSQARPRVAGWIEAEGKGRRGLVEWVASGGQVLERMTFDQLRALGWVVNFREYGVLLKHGAERVIITAWPRDFGGQYTEQDRRRMDDAYARAPSVSEPTERKRMPASSIELGVGPQTLPMQMP